MERLLHLIRQQWQQQLTAVSFTRLVVVLFPLPISLSLSAVCESKILKIDFDFRFVPNKSRGETSDSPKSGKLY